MEQTTGPYGGGPFCLTVFGTNLLAGTYGGGIFLSTNNGNNVPTAVNSGLGNLNISAFAVSGMNVFAGT